MANQGKSISDVARQRLAALKAGTPKMKFPPKVSNEAAQIKNKREVEKTPEGDVKRGRY